MPRLVPAAFLALVIAQPVWASDETIAEVCKDNTTMGDAICDCLDEKATDLTEDQQAFLKAALKQDDGETERLRGEMPVTDLMQAGMFIPNAATDCASGN